MFDIGFWELAIIGVVALLVVGPERLPKLARTAGFWVGRARRYVSSVKQDIEREMRTEELRQILEKQNQERRAYDIIEETREDLKETAREVDRAGAEIGARDRGSASGSDTGAGPGDGEKT
jgi:sec-independent protein translocase protein TatB